MAGQDGNIKAVDFSVNERKHFDQQLINHLSSMLRLAKEGRIVMYQGTAMTNDELYMYGSSAPNRIYTEDLAFQTYSKQSVRKIEETRIEDFGRV